MPVFEIHSDRIIATLLVLRIDDPHPPRGGSAEKAAVCVLSPPRRSCRGQSPKEGEMIRAMTLVAALSALAGPVGAEPAAPFLGTWKVVGEGEAQVYEARLVLTASGGTWQASVRQRNNPCAGREVPVKLGDATERQLTVTLQFADVMAGCKNSTVILTREADGTISGKRGSHDLKLSRQP
jgi:hypothetical protein